jgi:filamin
LEFEVRDPQGVQLKVDRLKNSAEEEQFNFLPTKAGPHSVSLNFAGFPVPGVPKTIRVEEKGQLSLQGPGIEKAGVELDQPAIFHLDTRQQPGGLKIVASDPQGNKIRHSTSKCPDNSTEITFRPSQTGIYNVAVDFNNKKLAGNFLILVFNAQIQH